MSSDLIYNIKFTQFELYVTKVEVEEVISLGAQSRWKTMISRAKKFK